MNWIADVARNAMPNPVTHSRQDYQPTYQAILGHPASQKLAEAAAEPIKTDVNGKEKYQIVSDAFLNEYITEPAKLGMALVSQTTPWQQQTAASPSTRPLPKTSMKTFSISSKKARPG